MLGGSPDLIGHYTAGITYPNSGGLIETFQSELPCNITASIFHNNKLRASVSTSSTQWDKFHYSHSHHKLNITFHSQLLFNSNIQLLFGANYFN